MLNEQYVVTGRKCVLNKCYVVTGSVCLINDK